MSDHDVTTDEVWPELLNALLDGELPPEEEERIRGLVADSPEAQDELAALARVRTLVRDLPPVDPPFGFYERMLRPVRRPRHVGLKVGGALAAAAAAIVLVVGITPATDSIVPPVEAYAARHLEMEPIVATAPAGRTPTTTTTTTATTTTTTAAGTTASAPETDFAAVADADLDALGTRTELTGDFHRMLGYRSPDGVVHLLYSDGQMVVSVYEQTGALAWDRLPAGTMLDVDGTRTWTMATPTEEVMVFERGPAVYTIVARPTPQTHDDMVELSVELPEGSDPSMLDRFRTSCRSMAARFSMGTSEP